MHPILFEVGNWPVYSYGVLLALAYLAGLQLAVMRARRAGLDSARIMDLGIYLIIAALVGAKLMLVIVDFGYFRDHPRELLSLVRVGGVFYGGLIFALLAGLWLVRRYKLPVWSAADMYAPASPSATSSAALDACSPVAVTDARRTCPGASPSPVLSLRRAPALRSASRFIPTQIYDAGAELLILIFLLVLENGGPSVSRPHLVAVHTAVRRGPVHRGNLPRRRSRHHRRLLDFAVRLPRDCADRDRHAAAAQARRTHGLKCPRVPRQPTRLTVTPADEGQRLDRFVAGHLPSLSRSQVHKLIVGRTRHALGRPGQARPCRVGRPGRGRDVAEGDSGHAGRGEYSARDPVRGRGPGGDQQTGGAWSFIPEPAMPRARS
jgi:phosphatidylglycerol:prolipoprotein diacylglycerol transferase